MPNATGFITAAQVRRMRQMREAGMTRPAIGKVIGCHQTTVLDYTRNIGPTAFHRPADWTHRHERAARYARFVQRASAYVPTFGAI